MNSLRGIVLLAVVVGAVGCASTTKQLSFPLTGDPLVDGPRAIAEGPERDKVLWEYRMAAAAMQRGQFDLAKTELDSALARIGGIFEANKESRKAKGYFTAEAKKTFLGEPYERVMAYYYRGILYWRDGEPDNARACFRSAAVQDADTENKTYASDYVLLDYLDGLATEQLGGDGSDAIQRARKEARLAIPPEPNPTNNVLVFVNYGHGPKKYAAGQYGEELRFRDGSSVASEVMIRVDDTAAHVGPYDDLNFQATTRGGRVMDHILGNKAVFKSGTDAAGTAGILSGAVLASNRDTQAAGLGLLAAGILSKVISASTRPEADTRTWDNLPLFLTFASFRLPPGPYTATVEFLNASRQPLVGMTKTIQFTVPEGSRDKVLFVSDKSTTPQTQ